MDTNFSFEVDFPKFEPPSPPEMKVTECWELADGSLLWKVEGQYIAELPKVKIIKSQVS